MTHTNTAGFSTSTNHLGDSTLADNSASVEVCRPVKTGALTMGFWQNKNGQAIITGQAKTGVCPSGTWLRRYSPLMDLSSTATCSQVASYVSTVIGAAKCSSTTNTCNSMLKAQMLATALDVYFSDPSLGGNKIAAGAPLGGVSIDLARICQMIDGSGGTGSCSANYEDASSAFAPNTATTQPAGTSPAAVQQPMAQSR